MPSLSAMIRLMQTQLFNLASIGGTFGVFHQGHKDYIDLAFSLAKRVQIGINDSEHAQTTKQYPVSSLKQRRDALEKYLTQKHLSERAIIVIYKNRDDFFNALFNSEIDCAVLSDEYYQTVQDVNRQRMAQRLPEYHIHVKPRTLIDGGELSSTALRNNRG
jgi:cytidyltransferase-like protein